MAGKKTNTATKTITQYDKEPETTKQEVVPTGPSSAPAIAPAPAFLKDRLDADSGKGLSLKAEDSVVPFIGTVEKLSPQLNSRHEKYMPQVEFGDILLKGAIPPYVKGKVGIIVQPCAFSKAWVEWVPRIKGGGFVARHDFDKRPSDTAEKPDPANPSRIRLYRANGNEIQETRYHFVLVNGQPYVIPFKSTGHTTSREWTQMMKIIGGDHPVAWSYKYKLTTRIRTRVDQEWNLFAIEPVGWVESEAEYLAGEAFYKAVTSGARIIGEEDDGGQAGESDQDTPF